MLSKMVKSVYNSIISDIVSNLETISAYYWAFYNTIKAIQTKDRNRAKDYFNTLKLIENKMLTGEDSIEIDGIKFKISQIKRNPIIVIGPPGVGKSRIIQNFANQMLLDENKRVKEKFREEIGGTITTYIIERIKKSEQVYDNNTISEFTEYMQKLQIKVLTTTLSNLRQWQLSGIVTIKDIGYNLEETSIDKDEIAYSITQNARPDGTIVPNFYPSLTNILDAKPIYWLWFLDELLNILPENMPIINQILDNGQIVNNSLSPNLTIVSASNLLVYNSLSRELPESILNKLSFVYIANFPVETRIKSLGDSISRQYLTPSPEKIYANTHFEYDLFIEEWILYIRSLEEEEIMNSFDILRKEQEKLSKVKTYTIEFLQKLKHLLLALPNETDLVNPKIQSSERLTPEEKHYKITYQLLVELINEEIRKIRNISKDYEVIEEIKNTQDSTRKIFAHIVSALSYKNTNLLMHTNKAQFPNNIAWENAMRRGISIIGQVDDKINDKSYYIDVLKDVVRILDESISPEEMIDKFYKESIVYRDFGYNIMELAGTVGSLPGVAYGLYLIVRSIEDNLK